MCCRWSLACLPALPLIPHLLPAAGGNDVEFSSDGQSVLQCEWPPGHVGCLNEGSASVVGWLRAPLNEWVAALSTLACLLLLMASSCSGSVGKRRQREQGKLRVHDE